MDFFTRSSQIDLKTLTNFSDLSDSVRQHLQIVYTLLTTTLLCASAGVISNLYYSIQISPIFLLLINFGLLFYIHMNSGQITKSRLGSLLAFGFINGYSISPLVKLSLQVDPRIVGVAIFCTTVVFACFSFAALKAQRRSFLYLGGFISSAVSILFLMSLMNVFVGYSAGSYTFHLYGSLLIFSLYVIFDTQKIVEKSYNGNLDFIAHTLELFIDFIALFVRILIILTDKNRNKKRNNNNERE